MIVPVVLAGGNGVRLWPLSRASHPKPYLPLLADGSSPFQAAVRAASAHGAPLVLGRDAHRFLAAEQLDALGLDATLVLEPDPRGEGAAVALAAFRSQAGDELLILPSDPPGSLVDEIGAGWRTGRDGDRVVWDRVEVSLVRHVVAELVGPAGVRAFERAAQTRVDLSFHRIPDAAWSDVPHLDVELLRRAAGAVRVHAEAGEHLSDWSAVHRSRPTDLDGNVVIGDAILHGAEGCLVHAQDRLVAALDVRDLAIVETADAVLVAPRDAADRVKDLVAALDGAGRTETQLPRRVLRPWGAYEGIGSGPRWLAKRIVVQPGQALSLQRHQDRAEHWIVVSGRAVVQRGDERFELGLDASTYIPRGTVHRLENAGDEPLVLIEVQTGDRLDEEDIERLEDRYGRRR